MESSYERLEIDAAFPEVGFGVNSDELPFSWNKECLILKIPGSPKTRQSPPRKTLAVELEKESQGKTCSDPNCHGYEEGATKVACSLCKKYIHLEHCCDYVDVQVWCVQCLQKNISKVVLCQKCENNYFRKEKGYQSLDGNEVICKTCFDEDQKDQVEDTEATDPGVVDDETMEQSKGSAVEELDYQCCAKENCTNQDEAVVRSEHTRCHGCNGHCHIECFVDGSDLCHVCAASSQKDKKTVDDASDGEEKDVLGDEQKEADDNSSSGTDSEGEEEDEARESGDDKKMRQSAGSKRKKPSSVNDSRPKRKNTKK